GTDSMYPARFGIKPGVCHGSNVMRYGMHKHPRTIFIPKQLTKDLGTTDTLNEAKIDYSIDPDKAAFFAFNEISKIINKQKNLSDEYNFFFTKPFITEIEKNHDQIIVKVSSQNPFYCSINEADRRFDYAGNNPEKVIHEAIYSFYFHALQSENLNVSL